jgi:hypothetical protein
MTRLDPPTRRRAKGIRLGRGIAVLGMAALCVLFFLPLEREEPRSLFGFVVKNPASALAFLPFLYAPVILVILGLRAAVRRAAIRRGLNHAACLFAFALFLLANIVLWRWWWVHRTLLAGLHTYLIEWWILAVVAAATLGTVSFWAKAPEEGKVPACVATAGFCSAAYFVFIVLEFTVEEEISPAPLWLLAVLPNALVGIGGLVEACAAWRYTPPAVGTHSREGGS